MIAGQRMSRIMPNKFKGNLVEGEPAANWQAIHQECAKYQRFIVEVREYNESAEISMQQMAYLHSIVFPALADHVGCSKFMAEQILKKKCGEQWFVKKVDGDICILSKTNLSVKQTNEWFENIFDWMGSIGCPVPSPDKDWRLNKSNG